MTEYCFEENYRNKHWFENLMSLDAFAVYPPGFNFEGRQRIGSPCGVGFTIFFYTAMTTYLGLNVSAMVNFEETQIVEILERDAYDSTNADAVDLENANMLGAFYVSDFITGEEKSDPNFVQWKAYMCESDGIPENEFCLELGVHTCTPEDWENIYPSNNGSKQMREKIQSQNLAKCVNKEDPEGRPYDLRVYGKSENENHRRLDIQFQPCTPIIGGRGNCSISNNTSSAFA